MTAGQPRRSIPTLGEVVRQFPAWLRNNVRAALISVVLGGLFGYLSNVLLIAVRYDGYMKVPPGAPATGFPVTSGLTGSTSIFQFDNFAQFFQGSLFWGLCGMVICAVGSYWYTVGTQRFFADLRGFPSAIAGLIRGDSGPAVHLLWGAAAAMVVALIVSPSMGALVALGLLAAAPGLIGSIIAAFLRQVWHGLLKLVAPTRAQAVGGITGVTVGLLGSAVALVVAFVIPFWWVKLILALVLAVAAVVIGRAAPPPPAVTSLLIAIVFLLCWLNSPGVAFAHDGGWSECASTGQFWLTCGGTPNVLAVSAVGGAASAGGGILGGFLGSLAGTGADGGSGGPPGPAPDLPPVPDQSQYAQAAPATPGPLPPPAPPPPATPSGAPATPGPLPPPAPPPPAAPSGDDSRIISGDEARRALWAATHQGQPYDPNAPLYPPAGGFPPGISGGGWSATPDGRIDPNQPIALVVPWSHPPTPPTDQWLNPPPQGFDGNKLASDLQKNFGLPTNTVTGPDGNSYVKVPENLPPNIAGSAWGTKNVGGQPVIDPNGPIMISHWPPTPPGPPPPVPTGPPPPQPSPQQQPDPQPRPQPSVQPPDFQLPQKLMPPPQPQPPPGPPPDFPLPQKLVPPPQPQPQPPPQPQPQPQPQQDDADKAERKAVIKRWQKQAQAEADWQATKAKVYDAGAKISTVVGFLADAGVNIISNLLSTNPATRTFGKVFNYGYTAVKDVAGGMADNQSVGQIAKHVGADFALNAGFNKVPTPVDPGGTLGTAGKVMAAVSGTGNAASSTAIGKIIDKHPGMGTNPAK